MMMRKRKRMKKRMKKRKRGENSELRRETGSPQLLVEASELS